MKILYIEMFIFKKTDIARCCYFFAQGPFGMSALALELLGRGDDIQTTVRLLVDAANAAGGRDNTTVVLAESE